MMKLLWNRRRNLKEELIEWERMERGKEDGQNREKTGEDGEKGRE